MNKKRLIRVAEDTSSKEAWVEEQLNNLTDDELFSLLTAYGLDSISNIYMNDEDVLNDELQYNYGSYVEAFREGRMAGDDFNWSDKYFTFNGYNHVVSFSNLADYVDLDRLAEDIVEDPDHSEVPQEIQDYLAEHSEEEE